VIAAVSGQQTIGLAIAIALAVGWGVYVVFVAKKADTRPGDEIETAPNRKPYLEDDAMEGPRLDRALSWGLITLAFVAIALPVYWLREPTREANALKGFDQRSVARGAELFESAQSKLPPGHIAAGCADCHGNKGQGGVVLFTLQDPRDKNKVIPVKWEAPALNTVLFRFSPDEVRKILEFGRPPTPMPAWGVNGGGALGDQQLDDLVNFLISIQISQKQALSQSRAVADGSHPGDGEKLFDAFCARCHTLGWSYRDSYQEPGAIPGGGAYGPNLTNGDTLRQFPLASDQVDFVTAGSDFGKNYGRRGIGNGRMPGFGPDPSAAGATEAPECVGGNSAHCTTYRLGAMLTRQQIQAIVLYERSL
jgi:mono/diheme cytochrome c family protein